MNSSKVERRREERVSVAEGLISVSMTEVGTEQEIMGFIIDKSKNGFRMTLSREIAPEALAEFTLTKNTGEFWETEHYLGRICWCKPDKLVKNIFNAGVEINEILMDI